MKTYVAFLRGINVGGHRKVKMNVLKQIHAELGHADILTYLQSGNVAFKSAKAPQSSLIETAYETSLGFPVDVILLEAKQLEEIVENSPITLDAKREPQFLHAVMLSKTPSETSVTNLLAYDGPEEVHVLGKVIYVYYTNGVGRSKFTLGFVEKTLGLLGTGRNWNTMLKLQELSQSKS